LTFTYSNVYNTFTNKQRGDHTDEVL